MGIRKFCVVIVLIIVILMPGCHGKSELDYKLQQIDSLLNVDPEIAYELISGIDTNEIKGRSNREFYTLLLAEARYKNYYDDTIDSEISGAARYFQKKGDKRKAARALFQKGVINFNNENYGEAIISYLDAIENLDSIKDKFLYAYFNNRVSDLFLKIGDAPTSALYSYRAYKNFEKTDSVPFKLNALEGLSLSLLNSGKIKEGIEYAELLNEESKDIGDSETEIKSLIILANASLRKSDFAGAKLYYRQVWDKDKNYLTKNNLELFISSMLNTNSSADTIQLVVNELDSIKDEVSYYMVQEHKGKYEKAFQDLKNDYDSLNNLLSGNKRINVHQLLRLYNENKIQVEKNNSKINHERTVYFAVFMIFIIIFILLYYKLNSDKMKNQLKSLQYTLSIVNSEMELLKYKLGTKDNNLHSHYLLNFFKKISDVYLKYNSISSTELSNKRTISSLSKEINIINDDANFYKELATFVDKQSDGTYKMVLEYLGKIKEETKKLIILLYLGFSRETICLLLNISQSNFYNRKSRILAKLRDSSDERVSHFLRNQ